MSVLRIMQYTCCPIQHSCFRYSQTNNHMLNSISFYLHVTLISFIAMFMLSLCYGAEGDMFAAQCNILIGH